MIPQGRGVLGVGVSSVFCGSSVSGQRMQLESLLAEAPRERERKKHSGSRKVSCCVCNKEEPELFLLTLRYCTLTLDNNLNISYVYIDTNNGNKSLVGRERSHVNREDFNPKRLYWKKKLTQN